jgi:hypothetical protein
MSVIGIVSFLKAMRKLGPALRIWQDPVKCVLGFISHSSHSFSSAYNVTAICFRMKCIKWLKSGLVKLSMQIGVMHNSACPHAASLIIVALV